MQARVGRLDIDTQLSSNLRHFQIVHVTEHKNLKIAFIQPTSRIEYLLQEFPALKCLRGSLTLINERLVLLLVPGIGRNGIVQVFAIAAKLLEGFMGGDLEEPRPKSLTQPELIQMSCSL